MSDHSETAKVKVDGEEAILHITDQSVMFEKGGKVSGFERSAIRMVKPDGDAMIIAYSAGSVVKSVRVEPVTAVASLLVSPKLDTPSSQTQASAVALDQVFETMYRDTRKDLEERLDRIDKEPENMSLRLTDEEFQRYGQTWKQMGSFVGTKYGFNPWSSERNWFSFRDLDKEIPNRQLDTIKLRHIQFLYYLASDVAEHQDGVYAVDDVWPEEWDILIKHYIPDASLPTVRWSKYVAYLRAKWTHRPKGNRTDSWIRSLT